MVIVPRMVLKDYQLQYAENSSALVGKARF
jgi:hypothetical protein